jgi:hypothetical protein
LDSIDINDLFYAIEIDVDLCYISPLLMLSCWLHVVGGLRLVIDLGLHDIGVGGSFEGAPCVQDVLSKRSHWNVGVDISKLPPAYFRSHDAHTRYEEVGSPLDWWY